MGNSLAYEFGQISGSTAASQQTQPLLEVQWQAMAAGAGPVSAEVASSAVQPDRIVTSLDQTEGVSNLLYTPGVNDGSLQRVGLIANHVIRPLLIGEAFVGAIDPETRKSFTRERLNNIAIAAQYADQLTLLDGASAGYRLFLNPKLTDRERQVALAIQESHHALNGRTVGENQTIAIDFARANRYDDFAVGIALHPFVDAQDHFVRAGTDRISYAALMAYPTYPAGVGDANLGSTPDYASFTRTGNQTIALIQFFEAITGVSADSMLPGSGISIRERVLERMENTLTEASKLLQQRELRGQYIREGARYEQAFNEAARMHYQMGH